MDEKSARYRAIAGLQADHIKLLAEEIARPRPKNQRPSAWSLAVTGRNPEEVALVVLWCIMRPRREDTENAPSVVTVAEDIARKLGADKTLPLLFGSGRPVSAKALISVGASLLHFAFKVGLIQTFQGAEAARRDGGRESPRRILLSAAAQDRLAEYTRRCISAGLANDMFPLTEPPDPHLDPVRPRKNWRGVIEPPDPPPAFVTALEHIRQTPWRVNKFVYQVMFGALDAEQVRYLFRDLQEPGWKSDCKRKDRVITLEIAGDFLNRPLWLDVSMDYRGRIYHGGALRFNGAENTMRPLLEFAEGEVLTESGASYLAAYTAAQWQDEITDDNALEQWTRDNETLLLNVASDPEKHDNWMRIEDEDKRWYALAAADAWRQYREGLPVHLPCSWDAVTSGLQVYALLMRDEETAKRVALMWNTTGDYYEEIARRCPGETRKTAKAVAMPLFYSATLKRSAEKLAELDGKDKREWHRYRKRAERLRAVAEELAPSFVAVRDWLQKDVAPIFGQLEQEIRWTTPEGFNVVQDNHLVPEERIDTYVDGARISLTVRWPKGGLDKTKQRNSLPANIVHSLDASWLVATVNHGAAMGIRSWGIVHDCYAVHPNHVDALIMKASKNAIRDVFGKGWLAVEQDWLTVLHREFQDKAGVEIPPPPAHPRVLSWAFQFGFDALKA